MDGQDAAPTPVMENAYTGDCTDLGSAVTSWNELMKTDLANLNGQLVKQKLSALSGQPLPMPVCK